MRLASDQVAIVLAAGRGRRMGTPKALMQVASRPWWQWQAERLREAGVPDLWVVSPEARRAISGGGREPIRMVEGDPEAPQFESFLAGVRELRASAEGPPEGVFVLPVDVPAPGKRVWQTVCEAGRVAVPMAEGVHGHPLFLAWDWLEEVLRDRPDHARASQLRLDALIAPVATYVEVHDPSVAVNLNTPEDVERWLATGHAPGPDRHPPT
jgi:CTP:molybdopterin cytidylyltransferase MocA